MVSLTAGLKRWFENRKIEKELGKASKGGEQGAFDLHRFGAPKPYIHKKGSGAWVIGKVHDTDLKSTNGSAHFLSTDEECHGWVMGPTRSGKNVTQMMRNVLTYDGSQVIFGTKGEEYLVAGKVLAAKGKKVYLLDPLKTVASRLGVPAAPHECDFNPMLDVMIGPLGLSDPNLPKRVTDLTEILVDLGKGGDQSLQLWNLITKSVVSALLAYGLVWQDTEAERAYEEAEKDGTLANKHYWDLIKNRNILIASEFPSLSEEERLQMLTDMASLKQSIIDKAEEVGVEPFFPSVIDLIDKGAKRALALATSENPDGYLSLLEMISSGFGWVNSPMIKDHLRGYDLGFGMSFLKEQDDIALFVVIPDTALESHGAYFRMVFTSMVNACTGTDWAEGVNPKRHKINALCDEVALWGHMPALERIFKLGSGSGLRAIIFTQNKPMMDKIYGKEGSETFIDNSWQILLGGGGNETGEYFSKKAGKTKPRDRKTGKQDEKAPAVPVLGVDELWSMVHRKRKTSLFFENGKPPLLVREVRYFDDEDSGLRKFHDYTPHLDHATADDQLLDPSVPRELIGHVKGAQEGGRRHIQIGSGSRKQIESRVH